MPSKEKKPLDMCSGQLIGSILRFSLPLMATGVLSQLYNAMDTMIVGRCAGGQALAAVGATMTLCWLITETVLGLSVGTSVRAANACGARQEDVLSDTLHTSLLLGLIVGVLAAAVGYFGSRTFLGWIDTPGDILDQSTAYLQIFFLGMPANSVYMFAAAALRATGETRYPLLVLIISGLVNVALNLLSVAVLHMGVQGVAWATVISQVLSAIIILAHMCRLKGGIQVSARKLRIHGGELRLLLKLGVPAALQSAMFTLSNVIIQSGINSFGSSAVAGASAASSIESIVFLVADSISHAATIFAGQNMGAKKYDRVPRVLSSCLLLSVVLVQAFAVLVILLRVPLVSLFAQDEEVIRFGAERLRVQLFAYLLVGVMNTTSGVIRGMGYSVAPTVVSLVGVCGLRVAWMYTVFAWHHTFETLILCFPFTWLVTSVMNLICYGVVRRKLRRNALSGADT